MIKTRYLTVEYKNLSKTITDQTFLRFPCRDSENFIPLYTRIRWHFAQWLCPISRNYSL